MQKYKFRSQGSVAWDTWPTFKFWDPLISLEWLNIQNSNFAWGLMVRDTKPQNEKGSKGGVAYFT